MVDIRDRGLIMLVQAADTAIQYSNFVIQSGIGDRRRIDEDISKFQGLLSHLCELYLVQRGIDPTMPELESLVRHGRITPTTGNADVDGRELIVILQVLEKAMEFCNLIAESETVDQADYQEFSYLYERDLAGLCGLYLGERKQNSFLPALEEVIKYKYQEPDSRKQKR
ncbi:MAG: hypothetical protein HY308_02270 [Gammaproteobacteria bacterium]|nr:hypothetical protein [Gammaproteobacteria bacterium]